MEAIYEESGAIVIQMKAKSGNPHVLFVAGGYGLFSDLSPPPKKTRPPGGMHGSKGLLGGKIPKP